MNRAALHTCSNPLLIVLLLFASFYGVGRVLASCYKQYYDNSESVGCTLPNYLSQGPCHGGQCIPPGQTGEYCGDTFHSRTVRTGVALDTSGTISFTVGADPCWDFCDCTATFIGTITKTCTGWICGGAGCTPMSPNWTGQHANGSACAPPS